MRNIRHQPNRKKYRTVIRETPHHSRSRQSAGGASSAQATAGAGHFVTVESYLKTLPHISLNFNISANPVLLFAERKLKIKSRRNITLQTIGNLRPISNKPLSSKKFPAVLSLPATMATEFIGLQMLVTLRDPPMKLKGTVSAVEAGTGLTLSNGMLSFASFSRLFSRRFVLNMYLPG